VNQKTFNLLEKLYESVTDDPAILERCGFDSTYTKTDIPTDDIGWNYISKDERERFLLIISNMAGIIDGSITLPAFDGWSSSW